jgi:hypothetical protein
MNNYREVGYYGFGKDGRTLSLLSPRATGVYEGPRPPYLKSDELPYLMSWIIAQRIVYSQAVGETYSSATVPDMAIMLVTIGNWAASRVNNWAAAEKLRARSIRLSLQPPLPLESLWEPVADENWQKSYEEAFAVVYFIEEHYGEAAVPNILKNLGQAQSFSDLIEKSLGVSFTEFDQEWQAWLNRQGAEGPR